MDYRDQIRKLAMEMINYDISKSKEWDRLRSKNSLGTAIGGFICLGVIGFIIFFNIASLIVTNALFGKAVLGKTSDNIFLIVIAVAAFIWYIMGIVSERKARKEAKAIENTHNEYVRCLNEINDAHPKLGIEPWWNHIDGLRTVYLMNNVNLDLVWTPFTRMGRDGYICRKNDFEICKKITGGEAISIVNNPKYRCLFHGAIDEDEEYYLAELCLWFEDTNTITSVVTPDQAEIDRRMKEYSDKLDNYERWMNFFDGDLPMTNEEQYFFRTHDNEKYTDDMIYRGMFEDVKKEKIKNEKHTTTYTYHTQTFTVVGLAIIDSEGDYANILFQRGDEYLRECYEVRNQGSNKVIDIICRERNTYEELGVDACIQLWKILCGTPDPTKPRFDGLSLKEWGTYIYANYFEKG